MLAEHPNERDLSFLADVTRETLSSLKIGQLLWRVTQLLRSRFGYAYAAIGLCEHEHLVFRVASGVDFEDFHEPRYEAPWRVTLGSGILGGVAQGGEEVLLTDLHDEDPQCSAELSVYHGQVVVPLKYRDRILGVIDVRSQEPGALGETDLGLLKMVAALVAPAVDTARMYDKERRRTRDLYLVNEISRLVMSSLEHDELIATACQAVLDTMGVSFVAIALLESGRRVVQGGYASRLPFVDGVDFDRWAMESSDGLVGETIATGNNLRLGDVSTHMAYHHVVAGIHSHLSVPLKSQGETLGALVIEHTDPDRFSPGDERLAETVSGYVVQAIENARLFEGQRRRWKQLLLINDVARLATQSVDLSQIIPDVTREIHDRFGYPVVAMFLREGRNVVLRAVASKHELLHQPGDLRPLGRGLVGRVVNSGRPLQVDGDEELEPGAELMDGVQSVLAVPLAAGDQAVGALVVQSSSKTAFDADDRLVLETLAKSVGGAVANAMAVAENEQLREDLNRMVVHDLRNPVQVIQLTLQELLDKEDLALTGVRTVEHAIQTTDEVLVLVNSLLELSRFEAGRARLKPIPASLNDHVRAAVRQLGPLARSRGVQVTTLLSSDLPAMHFDHELIDRVIANLVANALKFTPEQGRVTVRTLLCVDDAQRCPMEWVMMAVQDTGEGIPAEYHDKIFEKFGQVESRSAGIEMSTGLGLTLCRHVVEAHGGQIWVESREGEGATFYVGLPPASARTNP
ncbi:MAG: GAF domain-containing protein [Deltaproteobacteria bacterium]|nr:GAF domain-containing protein [Deltaproteobacteria bacterium]